MIDLPALMTVIRAFHKLRLVTGSIPVVGSSCRQVSKTYNLELIMILQEAQFVDFQPELRQCSIYACFLHYNNTIAYDSVTATKCLVFY